MKTLRPGDVVRCRTTWGVVCRSKFAGIISVEWWEPVAFKGLDGNTTNWLPHSHVDFSDVCGPYKWGSRVVPEQVHARATMYRLVQS